jgi:Holliday junction resolvase
MNSKRKGKVGELEAALLLREHGFDARRGQQFEGTHDSPDVKSNLPYHVEVKRVERLNMRDAVAQAEGECGGKPWVVLHRWNNGQWLATVRASEFLNLVLQAKDL